MIKSPPSKNVGHWSMLKMYCLNKFHLTIVGNTHYFSSFSFLFLLAGEKKYHIIWETLDSEEATYIWHTDRTRESLQISLEQIEIVLRDIKKNGRQAFLETESSNFSRVVHDYADVKKGFVAWKGMLEEKLI